MKTFYLKQEKGYRAVEVEQEEHSLTVRLGKKSFPVDITELGGDRYLLLIGDRSYEVEGQRSGGLVTLNFENREWQIPVLSRQQMLEAEICAEDNNADSVGEIVAPMPGMVLRVEVSPGQKVESGSPLIVIEAMKMENEIRSSVAGKIAEILVKPGQAVEKDDRLVRIEN